MAAFEEINGVTLVTGATRAETGFTMQSSDAASYFCANGLAIVIYERTDGEAGCTVSWSYNGESYSKKLDAGVIICGGSWAGEVSGTDITFICMVRGAWLRYCAN